jgi:hypothetical protein
MGKTNLIWFFVSLIFFETGSHGIAHAILKCRMLWVLELQACNTTPGFFFFLSKGLHVFQMVSNSWVVVMLLLQLHRGWDCRHNTTVPRLRLDCNVSGLQCGRCCVGEPEVISLPRVSASPSVMRVLDRWSFYSSFLGFLLLLTILPSVRLW